MGKLGQLLVARGWINLQQLTRALQNQSVTGGRLGTCLLESDSIAEAQLQRGLAEQFGVPAVEIDDLRGIPDEVLALIPKRLARRCRAVPFRVEGGRLDLAMVDPRNLSCQDEIAFATSKRVKVYVVHEIRLFEALERYYGEECPPRYGLILDRLNRVRYLWQTPEARAAAAAPPPSASPAEQLFARPAQIRLPPPLPEPEPPPRPEPVPPARVPIVPLVPPDPPAVRPTPAAARPARLESSETPVERLQRGVDPDDTQPVLRARPPRPKTVELTAEERAELARAVAMPATAGGFDSAQPPSPQTEAEALAALETAQDLDGAGRSLLSFLALRFRRVALFRITRDRIQGWMIRGTGIDQDAFAEFSLGFDQPSLFLNLRQGSGLHVGPLPPMPGHRQMARLWGGDMPRDCVMVPVRLRDRLVTVLYADGAPKGAQGVDLGQLRRLGDALALAFERYAVAKRQRAASS
jgi:hypothetical protein